MKKILILIVSVLVIAGITYFCAYRYYADRPFILVYHKICVYKSGLRGVCVSPETFDMQMKFLKSRGYRAIALEDIVTLIRERQGIPRKIFAITFDDGYEDNYTDAYPILKKYNFTATIFLEGGSIGNSSQYSMPPSSENYLSSSQIRKMSGFITFGSHTVNHKNLSAITPAEATFELEQSKEIIGRITKQPVNMFCYPYGAFNDQVVEITKGLYSAACTTQTGLVGSGSDPYRLPRFGFKEIKAMSLKDIWGSLNFYVKILLGL